MHVTDPYREAAGRLAKRATAVRTSVDRYAHHLKIHVIMVWWERTNLGVSDLTLIRPSRGVERARRT